MLQVLLKIKYDIFLYIIQALYRMPHDGRLYKIISYDMDIFTVTKI